jgi:hypothetical protein
MMEEEDSALHTRWHCGSMRLLGRAGVRGVRDEDESRKVKYRHCLVKARAPQHHSFRA